MYVLPVCMYMYTHTQYTYNYVDIDYYLAKQNFKYLWGFNTLIRAPGRLTDQQTVIQSFRAALKRARERALSPAGENFLFLERVRIYRGLTSPKPFNVLSVAAQDGRKRRGSRDGVQGFAESSVNRHRYTSVKAPRAFKRMRGQIRFKGPGYIRGWL